jgi:hypothetical protein
MTELFANIGPLSTVARTVFVPAGQAVPVIVAVTEVNAPGGTTIVGGLSGSALVNSDGTAPPPIDGSVATVELHTPSMSDALVTSYANPTYQNPTFINPTFINPTFINPTFINPTFINPTFINPTFINPTFVNQPLATDVPWQVTNAGNVASGFNFGAIAASLPANASFQLIINRLYSTPGSNDCGLDQQFNADLQAVINNPVLQPASGGNPLSPDLTNATFALAAGDSALVTLRVFHDGTFDPSAVAARTVSQAANSDGSTSTARSAPAVSVPTGGVRVEATGPTGGVATFTATAEDATGSPLPVTCVPASGSQFAVGITAVACSATDPVSGKTSTASFSVTVRNTTPPVLTASASPNRLWPPNKAMTPVTVSGKVTTVSPATVRFSVWDEYGAVQPSGTVTLNADGTYSFTVLLQAWRAGTDSDGRHYIVTVTATDASGNVGSATATVVVSHNQ